MEATFELLYASPRLPARPDAASGIGWLAVRRRCACTIALIRVVLGGVNRCREWNGHASADCGRRLRDVRRTWRRVVRPDLHASSKRWSRRLALWDWVWLSSVDAGPWLSRVLA